MKFNQMWVSGISLSALLLGLSGCGTSGKTAVHTPSQVKVDTEMSDASKKGSYKPLTGHMDGVEFYINKDLAFNGLEMDKDELHSIFDARLKPWNPQRGFNLPVVRNSQVDKWITAFTGNIRGNFERWIKRGSHYVPLMEPILKEYGVPTDLIYLSMIESGFNTHAYSHAHAAGLWQFIPGTGRMYGLETGSMIDERRDIAKATRAAASHLRDLHKQYGDWYLAFAAYNAGPGTVNRAIRLGGTKNYWALSNSRQRLFRQETKDYVPKILAAAIIMKNYKKYGFSSSLFERPLKADEIQIANATDLSVLADCANVSFEEVKYLNPSLVGCLTPAGKNYTVYLPEGTSGTFQKNYSRIGSKDRVRFVSHKVRKRETLSSIAKNYKVDPQTITAMNGLSAKATPKVGSVLRIPRAGASKSFFAAKPKGDEPVVAMAQTVPLDSTATSLDEESSQGEDAVNAIVNAALDEGDKVAGPQPADGDNAPGVPELAPDTSASAGGDKVIAVNQAAKTHKVKRGETFTSVSKRYGVSVASLRNMNDLTPKSLLKAGQVLKVSATVVQPVPVVAVIEPAAAPSAITPALPAASAAPVAKPVVVAVKPAVNKTYKVQSGDTLDRIAKKNGTTVNSLMKANGFTVSSLIRPGQVLKLSGAKAGSIRTASALSAKEKLIIHAVRKGETLWTLSRKYGVTVTQIKNWNKLGANNLMPNQKIRIYVQSGVPAKKMAAL